MFTFDLCALICDYDSCQLIVNQKQLRSTKWQIHIQLVDHSPETSYFV